MVPEGTIFGIWKVIRSKELAYMKGGAGITFTLFGDLEGIACGAASVSFTRLGGNICSFTVITDIGYGCKRYYVAVEASEVSLTGYITIILCFDGDNPEPITDPDEKRKAAELALRLVDTLPDFHVLGCDPRVYIFSKKKVVELWTRAAR